MTYFSECLRRHSWNICKLLPNEFIVSVCQSVGFNLDVALISLVTCGFLLFPGVNFDTSGLVLIWQAVIIYKVLIIWSARHTSFCELKRVMCCHNRFVGIHCQPFWVKTKPDLTQSSKHFERVLARKGMHHILFYSHQIFIWSTKKPSFNRAHI